MSDEKEKGFCCRLLKFAALCVVGFLGFAVLLAATLPLWIGPVATRIAEKVVPGLTGTDFRIERFCLNDARKTALCIIFIFLNQGNASITWVTFRCLY